MIVALELPGEIDLAIFSQGLVRNRIFHRISESGGYQLVWVADDSALLSVRALWADFQSGKFDAYLAVASSHVVPAERGSDLKTATKKLLAELPAAPLTLTLILACLICYPITIDVQPFSDWLRLFNFTDFHIFQDRIYFADLGHTLDSGQYWRLVSPMFLHFGILHLVFNLVWLLNFGRRIESVNGALWLLVLVLATSLCANLLQYWAAGPGLVGGMSGVIYGLVGFGLTWHLFQPHQSHGIPVAVYIALLVFLGIGFSGIADVLFQVSLANWAHLGGLLSGMGLGALSIIKHHISSTS